MRRSVDLTGQRFGKLVVIGISDEKVGTHKKWLCQCDCGNQKAILGYNLTSKNKPTRSCGCIHKESVSKPNKYKLEEVFGKCYLGTGGYFLFDLEDYEKLKKYTWQRGSNGYIESTSHTNKVRLHRYLMGCPEGMVVDHINHDKSDNRKCNLRICTVAQNNLNKSSYKNKSGEKGVYWDRNKWKVVITLNKKDIQVGRFDSFEDAVKTRKEAEIKYFGEYANTKGD